MPVTECELHHTAYRVADVEKSLQEWCGQFGARVELPPTLVRADQVTVAFLVFAGGRVELISSATPPPPVQARRPDHICLLCSDFDNRVARASGDGGFVVRPPVPSEAFGMRRMCFILYDSVGLVELVEK